MSLIAEHANEAPLREAPSGFRAYRSKGMRKRSSGSLEGEGAQKHSCSSGRTRSLEAPPEKQVCLQITPNGLFHSVQ